jgi:NAD(P)-dependent dehydrogenase (short-subunit alcohol dehydrogenase family)
MAETSRVALVTGAGSGIGRAVALKLQAAGYDVTVLGRRSGELEKTAGDAKSGGGNFLVAPADVTDEGGGQSSVRENARPFRAARSLVQ